MRFNHSGEDPREGKTVGPINERFYIFYESEQSN